MGLFTPRLPFFLRDERGEMRFALLLSPAPLFFFFWCGAKLPSLAIIFFFHIFLPTDPPPPGSPQSPFPTEPSQLPGRRDLSLHIACSAPPLSFSPCARRGGNLAQQGRGRKTKKIPGRGFLGRVSPGGGARRHLPARGMPNGAQRGGGLGG